MRRVKWWLRRQSQRLFPKATLAILANRTWVHEPEVALVGLMARRRGLAVDAGANKGVYAFHMSRHFHRVLAFEPLPEMASYLRRAAPANVRVHQLALSSAPGMAELRLPDGFNELGSLEPHDAGVWQTDAKVETHQVKLATLDSYALSDVAFLKIDVEGHEMSVLEGAKGTLQDWHPAVLVEVEDRHRSGSLAQVRAFFSALDYMGFYLDGTRLVAISEFDAARDQNTASLDGSAKVAHYINNFMFFDRREAAERVRVIEDALASRAVDGIALAGQADRPLSLGARLRGSVRIARAALLAQAGR